MKLAGKVAVITGGSSGIGLETARLFVEEGARVAITGRDPKRLAAAVADLGGKVLAVAADAGSIPETEAAVKKIAAELGGIDIVFANAGIAGSTVLGSTELAAFEEVFRTNVTGVYFTVQAALPYLREGGSVILNGSVHAVMGAGGSAAYAATKAAVRSLARSFATELLPKKVRATVVIPGATSTPIWNARAPNPNAKAALEARFARQIPMGRMVEPREVAQAVLFLASSDSSMITGSEIVVDGGMTQNPYGAAVYR